MNNITICAKYKGDSTTERGFRTMLFEIPPTGGKRPVPVPIFLVPSFAAQDSCAAGRYAEGTHILINGRLYPHEDGKMYVVPTQPLESLKMPINLNQIVLAGNVGYIFDQVREDAFNFGMMLKAPPQKALGHTWQDSLGFKCESWGDDAKRLMRFIYEGRAISLGGTLKFETWIDKDGNRRNQYKVRVRSMQYQFHGKKEENAEIEEKIDKEIKEIVGKKETEKKKSYVKKKVADDVPF
ncbi:MAG: hypothetical protein VXY28_08840 [Bacteroidota bacterium]|nr:hypothetical protein [Bacteroidota bacterium]